MCLVASCMMCYIKGEKCYEKLDMKDRGRWIFPPPQPSSVCQYLALSCKYSIIWISAYDLFTLLSGVRPLDWGGGRRVDHT